LAFTTTLKIPDDVIAAAIQELKQKCMNDAKFSNDTRWMIKDGMPDPNLGVVPIVSNLCAVSSISFNSPKPTAGDDPWMCIVEGTNYDTSVKDDKGNVIATGSTNPTGENAFTLMLGQFPATILEQAFKGASSPIYVSHRLQHMFYMDAFHAHIHADFDMCYTYVSAELKAKYLWAQADVQGAYSDLEKQGALTYDIAINNMILTPDQQKTYQAQTDTVFGKIQDWFLKTMVDQTPTKPDPAKAADNDGCVGVSLAVKFEIDESHTDLEFDEDISETYLQYNLISADMCGLANKMGNDPANIAKYFQTVHLDNSFRKVHVIASADAYWQTADKTLGDPINQIILEVSYPNPDDTTQLITHNSGFSMKDLASPKSTSYVPAIWTNDNQKSFFIFDFARLDAGTGSNGNVNPDAITVTKTVYYDEDPRVEVTDPIVEVETVTDHTIVVQAKTLGTLRVSPITLDTELPQIVEVNVTISKPNRQPETLTFNFENQKVGQSYLSVTSQRNSSIPWSYQVEVVVMAKFPAKPIRYTGPINSMVGSGPLIVALPNPPKNLVKKINKLLGL